MGQAGLLWCEVALRLKVSRDTLNEWERTHPAFSDARKAHKDGLEAFFANTFREAMLGHIPKFNVTAGIWLSKNSVGWRDKLEHSGDPDRPVNFMDYSKATPSGIGVKE